MTKLRRAGGWAAVAMAVAMLIPILQSRYETGEWSTSAVLVAAAVAALFAVGMGLVLTGSRQSRTRDEPWPSGVRLAVAANGLVLAFLALELCDRLVRQGGKLFYWTTFLIGPVALIFVGLVEGRRWAWRLARGGTALAVVWFLAFAALGPFADLRRDGAPIPWQGRVYVVAVSLTFAFVLGAAFRLLGLPDSRGFFNAGHPR